VPPAEATPLADVLSQASVKPNVLPVFPLPKHPNKHFQLFFRAIPKIERELGYEFKSKALLVEALTHGSYAEATTPSFQRLEFLGDAVLELLVTEFLFQAFPLITPGELTYKRQKLVSNRKLAETTVNHGFHKFIFHHSAAITTQVKTFCEAYTKKRHRGEKMPAPPKILGDIFESLLGAVFVDSNQDLESVFGVLMKLMDFRTLWWTFKGVRPVSRHARMKASHETQMN
jgi:dsRNA-specific ribonuclease